MASKRENLPSHRVTFEKRVDGKGHRRGHEIRLDGAPRGVYDGIQHEVRTVAIGYTGGSQMVSTGRVGDL